MNVLVTGSTGFIGTAVVQSLKDHTVYGVSRSIVPHLDCYQHNMDILDGEKLYQLMCEKSIDMVVHCAGKAIVSDCDKNPYEALRVNGLGTASVLDASRRANVKRVISVETDKVYGFQEDIPTREDATPNPNSPYEFSKVIANQMNNFYRDEYGLDVIAVRPVNVFGGRDPNNRLIPKIFSSIRDGRAIPIHSDAVYAVRDFIYVNDVAHMIKMLLLSEPRYNTYNFSSGYNFTIPEIVKRVKKVLTYNKPDLIIDKVGDYKEIPVQEIDGTRFTEEYQFKYTDFDTAIRDSYNEFLQV